MIECRTVVTAQIPVVVNIDLYNLHNLIGLSLEAGNLADDLASEEMLQVANEDGIRQELCTKAAACFNRIADAASELAILVAEMKNDCRLNQKKEGEAQTGVE